MDPTLSFDNLQHRFQFQIATGRKRIVMLHVKDTGQDGGNCALGEGRVDWTSCREAVREIGYDTPDAWFVLETPAGDDPVKDGARYLEFTRAWLAS